MFVEALKKSFYTTLPWDVPWHDPSHAVFMGVVYLLLAVIGAGLTVALLSTLKNLSGKGAKDH